MTRLREQLGFVVHAAEMFNHYGPVWKLMPSDSFEIVVAASGEERVRIHQMAMMSGYTSVDAVQLIKERERYHHLVSNHSLASVDGVFVMQSLGERNIRFMYALGKARHNFAEWNKLYDMIMCFGPYQVENLDFCESSIKAQMGYPRYDDYFNKEENKEEIAARYDCDPNLPTIVWLPTWVDLCSLDLYSKDLAALSSAYNVIVKPHPLSIHTEQARIERLRGLPFTRVITEHVDNLELFRIADYVACDYGGTAFGALYLDKNILLLNVPGAENDVLTGKESADITLRETLFSIDPSKASEIPELLADDVMWEQQKQVRRQLRGRYFAPYQGFSAIVAANVFKNRRIILAG